jgi:hypothetical protein
VFSADNRQLQTICSQALSHEIIRLITFTISNLNDSVLREFQFVWLTLFVVVEVFHCTRGQCAFNLLVPNTLCGFGVYLSVIFKTSYFQ